MNVPFALSVHSFVNSVGAYVGLASIIAVAILVLLYFAHARETATLRDRLDEAQQRISGLEGRIGQLMQAQAAGARRVPGPVAPVPVTRTPAPVPVRPSVIPVGAAARVPIPATAAAMASTAPSPGVGGGAPAPAPQAASVLGAPAGTAAPALASATKLIPDPEGTGAPDDTVFVPAAAVAATNGQTAAARAQALSGATQSIPVAAVAARPPSASPRSPVAAPPRMQIAPEPVAAAGGAAGPAGSSRVRRIGGNPKLAPELSSFGDEPAGGGRLSGRVLPIIIGIVAAAVIIAGLIVITSTGGGATTGQVHNNTSSQTGAGLHKQQTTPVAFRAGNVTVAVLNGTAQAGLAGDVGTKLVADGYKKGNITNAASQTQALTFVYYLPGKGNKAAALHVARALSLSPTRIHRAGPSVKQSCAISATGTSLGSCTANVIVTVGQDRVTLASGSSG